MPTEAQNITDNGQAAKATGREAVNFRLLTEESVVWHPTGDPIFPYEADVEGVTCLVRLNDFPAEVLYTLFVDGEEIVSFNDWPHLWLKRG